MEILSFVIFAFCISNVKSKMQVEGVQAESIRLKLRGIHSDKGNEYGLEGESTWYCQRIKDNDGPPHSTNPVYFVQPQSKRYKHNVVLDGALPTKTDPTIYVLPPKNSHEIEIETAENGAAVAKPKFFFLKNHPFENDNGHSHSQRSVSSVSISATTSLAPPHQEYPSFHRHSKRNRTLSNSRRAYKVPV